MNILIWGIGGKMGKNVMECMENDASLSLVGGVDKFAKQENYSVPVFRNADEINVKVDAVIDFSRPDALTEILTYSTSKKVPVVLCTTGYSKEQEQQIIEAAKIVPLFRSSNMSLGINVLINLCQKAAQAFKDDFEVEIIEQHHDQKVDSPSGTAISIANAINEEFNDEKEYVYGRHNSNQKRTKSEIGIHAVRGGTIVGKHDVLFIGQDEIVTIAHEAQSKMVFAKGAVKAAKFMATTTQPKIYSMQDLVNKLI